MSDRKYGDEFLRHLADNDEICSYCATDDAYIKWLENEIDSLKRLLYRTRPDKGRKEGR